MKSQDINEKVNLLNGSQVTDHILGKHKKDYKRPFC